MKLVNVNTNWNEIKNCHNLSSYQKIIYNIIHIRQVSNIFYFISKKKKKYVCQFLLKCTPFLITMHPALFLCSRVIPGYNAMHGLSIFILWMIKIYWNLIVLIIALLEDYCNSQISIHLDKHLLTRFYVFLYFFTIKQ